MNIYEPLLKNFSIDFNIIENNVLKVSRKNLLKLLKKIDNYSDIEYLTYKYPDTFLGYIGEDYEDFINDEEYNGDEEEGYEDVLEIPENVIYKIIEILQYEIKEILKENKEFYLLENFYK